MADFLNTGGGLPQTVTPFAMDTTPAIMAITQQMVKSRRQEIADSKLEITKNEDMLLKAMDFEVVQGLSDKVQMEHMSRLEQFQKDGAELMLERRGMLSNADKLKIVQEKRRIDSEIGSMKANVLAYNKLSEELVKQRNEHRYDSYLDLDKTAVNMNKWVEDGNIGKPVLGLLAYRDIQPGEIVEGIYGDQLKEFAKQADEEIALKGKDDPAGTYKIITDYQKKVDEFKNKVMATQPALRNKMEGANNYVDSVYGGQKLTSKWMPNYGRVNRVPAKDRYSGQSAPYVSMVEKGRTGDGYKVTDWGTPIDVSVVPEGEVNPTHAKFTPHILREDNQVEGTYTVTREKASEPMTQNELFDFKENNRVKSVKPAEEKGKFIAVYDDLQSWTGTIPYEQERDAFAKRDPSMEKWYQESDPYPKRTAQMKKEGKPSAPKQSLSVSEYNKAKGTNYTKKEIEEAFDSQYKIID